MPIPSTNFGATLFLGELGLQIRLFEQCMRRLSRAAQHWLDLDKGIDDGGKAPPLEIVADCSVCLSAMAAVRRVLFPSTNASAAVRRRSNALLSILGNPTLASIVSVDVRNAWEHLDERLDAYLVNHSEGKRSVSPIHVSGVAPSAGTVALRRFDPVDLAIHYAEQRIALRPCAEDIADLSARIGQAYVRLQNERVEV